MNGTGSAGSNASTFSDAEQLRAAQVHGQISNQEEPLVRKPTRLESLPPPGAKSAKKKGRGKQYNNMLESMWHNKSITKSLSITGLPVLKNTEYIASDWLLKEQINQSEAFC